MTNETGTQLKPRIIRGYSFIGIPIDGQEVQFVQPIFGPADYRTAGELILKAGLQIPTGKQMAFFLDNCYNIEEIAKSREAQEVREKIRAWFWDFKKNRYTMHGPENQRGLWVVRDVRAVGLSEELDKQQLEKMLDSKIEIKGVKFSSDKSVAFAPEKTYLNKPFDEANGYLIARGEGEEGAEALVRVSRNRKGFRDTGGVFLAELSKKDFERVSSLDDYIGYRLDVGGYYWYDYYEGFAVGVKETGEASSQKI